MKPGGLYINDGMYAPSIYLEKDNSLHTFIQTSIILLEENYVKLRMTHLTYCADYIANKYTEYKPTSRKGDRKRIILVNEASNIFHLAFNYHTKDCYIICQPTSSKKGFTLNTEYHYKYDTIYGDCTNKLYSIAPKKFNYIFKND